MPLALYLVVASDCDGNNRDRFVTAEDPHQAIRLMRKALVNEEGADYLEGNIRVFIVPERADWPLAHDWTEPALEIQA